MAKLGLILLVVALVGAGVSAVFFLNKGEKRVEVSSETIKNAVVATDFRVGSETVMPEVYLSHPGFVVVRVSEEGKPGKVLGVSDLLPAGKNMGVKVELEEPSVDGQVLFATLQKDDGDKTFSFENDKPIVGEWGGQIMMEYVVGRMDHGMEMM